MSEKTQDQQQKALLDALAAVEPPLKAIALLQMADEFYTKDERAKLYAEYERLVDADAAAYEHVQSARPPDQIGWEARVRQFGESAAREQITPMTAAMDAKAETSQKLSAFVRDHRLIMRLLEIKGVLSKGRHD